MLEVFLDVYDELTGVINNAFMANLAAIDKELLEELCAFLKLFDQAIDELSEEEKPTMHKVIPIRQLLLNHCDLKYEDSGELKQLKCFVGKSTLYVYTILHPSLKHFEIAPNEKSKAIALVRQELLKRSLPLSNNITATDHEGVATNPLIMIDKSKLITSNYLLTRCFDQRPLIPKPVLTPTSELDNYMSSDIQLRENDNVLLFWKENTELFPILSSMVRDLFAIPASNTTVERLFSSSKNTVTDRRTSLNGKNGNELLFLQKNLLSLQRIDKDASIKNKEQLKRKISTTNDEQDLLIEGKNNSVSSTMTK
ncbi:unnamed protein product [Rotaria socialis]